jgi:hypothetical protein
VGGILGGDIYPRLRSFDYALFELPLHLILTTGYISRLMMAIIITAALNPAY